MTVYESKATIRLSSGITKIVAELALRRSSEDRSKLKSLVFLFTRTKPMSASTSDWQDCQTHMKVSTGDYLLIQSSAERPILAQCRESTIEITHTISVPPIIPWLDSDILLHTTLPEQRISVVF